MTAKLLTSITLLFLGLTAFSQVDVEEKVKKDKTEIKDEKGKDDKENSSKEKPCNPEDPKRPLTKKDLSDLAEQFKLLQEEVKNLKTGVDGIPMEINKQYTKLKVLEDSLVSSAVAYKKLETSNKKLIEEKKQAENLLSDEKKQTNLEKNQKNQLSAEAEVKDKAYDQIVNDYILHCQSPDNSTIDLMKSQLKKEETKTKLDEFKKQASALQSAITLLKNENISKDEFTKAQLSLTSLIANSTFLGLQKSAIEVKADYDRFLELCSKFEEVMQENVKYTNPKFRGDEVYKSSEKYLLAIKPYLFLVKKFEDALTDPNCKLGIPLK